MHHPPHTDTQSRATLAATILGSSLAFVDGSVVNVALPSLTQGLHASPAGVSWTINAYSLPLGALILLGGALGDHFGRRRLFMLGLGLFTLASAGCAVAPSLAWLVAARGIQGFGAAILMPNSLAILGTEFAGEARGRAIGTWAAAGAVAGALGPILGGWLIDMFGWRSIFLINLPIALGAAYLAVKYVPERLESQQPAPLDAAGAMLATLALGSITWALTNATESHAQAGSWVAASGGIVLLAVFIVHERRLGEAALMPFELFASTTYVGLNLLTFFLYGSLGGLLVLMPYLLIQIARWSALSAGVALLPLPLLIAAGSRSMGKVASRYGSRMPLAVGAALVGVGLACYAFLNSAQISYWRDIFPGLLLVALGMGACVAPLTTGVLASVQPRHVGLASGFNSAMARIAGLIATALLSFVFQRQASTDGFLLGFRIAASIGAASALLAAVSALRLIESDKS